MVKNHKTVITTFLAMTIIAISGVLFNSCQKEETLTTKTEEITSVKQQKFFEGEDVNVSSHGQYYDATIGRMREISVTGIAFRYWYRGQWIYINFRSINIDIPPPPSGNPFGNPILSLNLEGMLVDAVVTQIQNGNEIPNDVNKFENYAIKVNGNELTHDFNISKEYIDEEGNTKELKVDYYTIKNDVFPLIIESLMGT